ncbi:hypothetical protein [Acetobacter orientalis]|uniref:hypothetical protein n=1 Tax=Acetobacter orientalis TaxID=146474 RepID=UPI0039E85C36
MSDMQNFVEVAKALGLNDGQRTQALSTLAALKINVDDREAVRVLISVALDSKIEQLSNTADKQIKAVADAEVKAKRGFDTALEKFRDDYKSVEKAAAERVAAEASKASAQIASNIASELSNIVTAKIKLYAALSLPAFFFVLLTGAAAGGLLLNASFVRAVFLSNESSFQANGTVNVFVIVAITLLVIYFFRVLAHAVFGSISVKSVLSNREKKALE